MHCVPSWLRILYCSAVVIYHLYFIVLVWTCSLVFVKLHLKSMKYLSCVCNEGCVCDLMVVCDVETVSDTAAVSDPTAVTDTWSFLSSDTGGQGLLYFTDVRCTSAFFGDVCQGDVIVDFCLCCGRSRNASCPQSSCSTPWISPSELEWIRNSGSLAPIHDMEDFCLESVLLFFATGM